MCHSFALVFKGNSSVFNNNHFYNKKEMLKADLHWLSLEMCQ